MFEYCCRIEAAAAFARGLYPPGANWEGGNAHLIPFLLAILWLVYFMFWHTLGAFAATGAVSGFARNPNIVDSWQGFTASVRGQLASTQQYNRDRFGLRQRSLVPPRFPFLQDTDRILMRRTQSVRRGTFPLWSQGLSSEAVTRGADCRIPRERSCPTACPEIVTIYLAHDHSAS